LQAIAEDNYAAMLFSALYNGNGRGYRGIFFVDQRNHDNSSSCPLGQYYARYAWNLIVFNGFFVTNPLITYFLLLLEQLSDVLEDYRLAWILKPLYLFAEITKRYLHLFPGVNNEVGGEEEFDEQEEDETEPPSLIVDPRYLQLLEIQKASPMVFDSTFGLIPEEVRSWWAQESQERDLLRKQVQQLRESKKLPPVRNWDYVPDPSTSPTLSVPVPLDPSRGSKKLSLHVTCSMATHNDEDHDDHVMINQTENIAAHAASPFLPGAPLWDD
jgi:hypothetical protein